MLKVKYIIVCIQLCLLCNWSIAQQASLNGKITNSDTGEVIEFANIYCKTVSKGAVSKKDGSFSLTSLPTGTQSIQFSCIGFQTISKRINLNKGNNTINIRLSPSITELEQFVITGTGTQHKIDEAPVQTEIISGKNIQEISGRSVEEIIASLSSSFDFSSSSMGTNIKINGLGKDYVLILVNGERLNGEIGGYLDLSRINSEEIAQIELVKGAASTLYGSDAIAGVINIITKKSKAKIKVTNYSRAGAHNEWKQLNTFSFNRNKLSGKTSISYKQTDGWQLNNMEFNHKWKKNKDLDYLVPTYDMPVNKKHSYTLKQSFEYSKWDKLSLNSDLSWYEKTLYFPYKGKNHNYYYNNRKAALGGKYNWSESKFINFKLNYSNYLYYSEYPNKYNETYATMNGYVSKTFYPGDRFKNSETTNISFNTKAVLKLSKKHTLNIGGESLSDFLESKYRLSKDNVNATTISLYAQDEYKLSERIQLVAGVRGIYHEIFGFMATPKFSAMYKKGKLTYRASFSKGFKAPTLKELYYYYDSDRMGTHRLYLGNEDLEPQKSNYYSFSTEYKRNKLSTSINIYQNELYDMIDYQIIETKWDDERRGIEETKKRYNINRARNRGVDFMFNASLFSGFSINTGYSYVDAKNLSLDIRLNGVAAHSATFKANWTKKWKKYKLKASLNGQYKSDKFYLEEDLERTYAKSYQLWKLSTSHYFLKLKPVNLSVQIGVDNIFDYVDNSPYGSHYGTLNPGRTLFFALNLSFKN